MGTDDSRRTVVRAKGWPSRGAWAIVVVLALADAAAAQDRRAVVFATIGGASIGHADSEQGKAPIFGGAIAFHLTPRLVVDGDVHGATLDHVFGREQHDFSQVTATASLLFRTAGTRGLHFVGGGGFGVQRARVDFTLPSTGRVTRTETLRLLHGRAGMEWDLTDRVVLRTEGVLWFGSGVDWVLGGRAGIGYRF